MFSEKTNWKENPSIVKLLSWKAIPSKKDILLAWKVFLPVPDCIVCTQVLYGLKIIGIKHGVFMH